MAKSKLSYCANQVQQYDHDRYLTCLFAPADRREALFALYAFNLEIAKTAEIVSEAPLGQMRLQWWSDMIENIYAREPTRHVVGAPLAEAIQKYDLTQGHFTRLIDARALDLDPEPPEDLAALEDYAERTASSLILLALEILGARGEAVEASARQIGIAWALTGLLRAIPFHAKQKRLYLPRQMILEAGVETSELFELRGSLALNQVVAQVATRAAVHLDQARAQARQVPRKALPAFLLSTLARRTLKILRKVHYDPFHPSIQRKSASRAWRLALAKLRRKY